MVEVVSLPKGHVFTAEQEAERIRWARRFISRLEGVGQGLGYGIFHGGSLIRDIDVVAVPWRSPDADKGATAFALQLVHVLGLEMGNYGDTLYGHFYVAMWAPGRPDHQIDLKVIRPGLTFREWKALRESPKDASANALATEFSSHTVADTVYQAKV